MDFPKFEAGVLLAGVGKSKSAADEFAKHVVACEQCADCLLDLCEEGGDLLERAIAER